MSTEKPTSVQLPTEIRRWIVQKAKEEERSISAQVTYLLRKAKAAEAKREGEEE
jgi:hypothetical protein